MADVAREGQDLRRLPPDELQRRARAAVDKMFGEIKSARESLCADLQPAAMIRRHPRISAAIAGVVGLWVARRLRGGRKAREFLNPRTLARTLGHSLLSSAAKTVGRALPGIILWRFARRGRGPTRGGAPTDRAREE